jgi:hypothetical protein
MNGGTAAKNPNLTHTCLSKSVNRRALSRNDEIQSALSKFESLCTRRVAEGVQGVKVGFVFSIGVFSANLQSGRHDTVVHSERVQADVNPLDGLKSR